MKRSLILAGIIVAGIVVLAVVVLSTSVPGPRYKASCLIAFSRNEIERLFEPGSAFPAPSAADVAGDLLRFDRVMTALKGSEFLEAREKRDGDAKAAARERQALYIEIIRSTRIQALSERLFEVTYASDNARQAQEVLSRLVQVFVEQALSEEWVGVRMARELARNDMEAAKDALDAAENQIVTFRKTHPEVDAGNPSSERASVAIELEKTSIKIRSLQKALAVQRERSDEQARSNNNKPGDKPNAEQLELLDQIAELEAQLDELLELHRNLSTRMTTLMDRLYSLPELERQLARLTRDKDDVESRYRDARARFRRIDNLYNLRKEGLVSWTVVSPAREPLIPAERPTVWQRLWGAERE